MSYDPRIANTPREEYEALLAIVRSDQERPLSDDDRWRRAYQDEQRRKRVVGYQPDFFQTKAITHFRRNPAAPEVERPPIETIEAKLERIRHDPLATYGPLRSDRPRFSPGPRGQASSRALRTGSASGNASASSTRPAASTPPSAHSDFSAGPGSSGDFARAPSRTTATSSWTRSGANAPTRSKWSNCATSNPSSDGGREVRGAKRATVRPIHWSNPMLTSRSQRWRQRRSSFVDDETLIDARDYAVDVLAHDQARAFVAEHHYLNRYPAAQLAVGLFGPGVSGRSDLVGVIVFGVPASSDVITRHTGFTDPARGCVLQRLLCLPSVAGNGESFFTSRAFRLLRREKPAIEAVVSFSDPQYGHCGTVYASLSGAYRGRTRARSVLRIAGQTISDRTLSKIRNLERGHVGAIDQLVGLGAPKPRPDEHPAAWLDACKRAGTLTSHRQSALFTYCFELSRDARRTGRALPRMAYPRFSEVVEAEMAHGIAGR